LIAALRERFNASYTPEGYARLQQQLERELGGPLRFRVAETPCFLPRELLDRCAAIGAELTHRLVNDPSYLEAALAAIPAEYRAPAFTAHPHFMTADFGLVREADGALSPRIVELQAFPSVYAYQAALCQAYRDAYELPDSLGQYLGGYHEQSYWEQLARVILNGRAPEHVILTEVEPDNQKTYPDFAITARRLGIRIVDIAKLVIERDPGKPARVFYEENGELVPVHRIYNRAIVDEILAKQIKLPFSYDEPLAVEWAGHPNWYFAISKFSLPYLDHPSVPPAFFLDAWLEKSAQGALPPELASLPREEWILKPLFGFAGRGILFGPSDEQLAAIPAEVRHGYLMQQRMHFTPVIETPFGPTQTEIRILYLWPDGGALEPVFSLTRLGRGKMMGVDHNRDQEWVGGSAAFYPFYLGHGNTEVTGP
jgi:hypothetical protein